MLDDIRRSNTFSHISDEDLMVHWSWEIWLRQEPELYIVRVYEVLS